MRNARFSIARKNSFWRKPRVMFRFRSKRTSSHDAAEPSFAPVAFVAGAQRMSSDSMETCRSNSGRGIVKRRARFHEQLRQHSTRPPFEKFTHHLRILFSVFGVVSPTRPGAGDRSSPQSTCPLSEDWPSLWQNWYRGGSQPLP